MRHILKMNQVAGLAAGILVGLAIHYVCPHEPAYATTGDRASHFSMATIPVTDVAAGILNPMDGVFVLDLVVGQLKGAVLNRQTGRFASFYFRDIGKDFDVGPNLMPEFCMVNGYAQLPNQAGKQMASGVIYIGELNSGKVVAYSFPWVEAGNARPEQLIPLDVFMWKQAGI